MINIQIKAKTSGIYKLERDSIYKVYEGVMANNYPLSSRKIIYGKTYVNGDIVYAFPSSIKNSEIYDYISVIIAIADHEIEGFNGIILDDQNINFNTSGIPEKGASKFFPSNFDKQLLVLRTHYGIANQSVDRLMEALSYEWDENCLLLGISYVHLWLKINREIFPTGALPHFGAIISGKKIKDICNNDNIIKYSYNPVLCLYDYLVNEIKIPIDLIDIDTFKIAAQVCDKNLIFPWDKESTNQPIYQLHGMIDTSHNPIQVINNMLATMDGSLIFVNGKWKIYAGTKIAINHSLNDNDLYDYVDILYTKNYKNKINSIKAIFLDEDSAYNINNVNIISDEYLNEDKKELRGTLDLSFTTNKNHAIYLATIALRKSRQQITINFPGKLNTLFIPINAGVKITLSRYNWINKPFRLIKSVFNSNTNHVDLVLQELNNNIWDL